MHELNIPGFVSDLKVKNLSMIAGGTGITPCYQIIKAVLNNPDDKTKINLVYSNTTQEDILLKEELQNLQKSHPDRFKVHFTLT
jgi:cytochrome-b5 reductase